MGILGQLDLISVAYDFGTICILRTGTGILKKMPPEKMINMAERYLGSDCLGIIFPTATMKRVWDGVGDNSEWCLCLA